MPVLVDGNTIIYESCIINEYLEEKYPDAPLLPADPGLRSKIRIMIDYGVNRIYPAYERLRNEMLKVESERNEVISEAKQELRGLLQRFEEHIGGQPYLAGDFSSLDASGDSALSAHRGMGTACRSCAASPDQMAGEDDRASIHCANRDRFCWLSFRARAEDIFLKLESPPCSLKCISILSFGCRSKVKMSC